MNHFFVPVEDKEVELVNQNKELHTKQNDRDDFHKTVCVKPWGYEFLPYESKKIGIWCLTVYKDQATSLHCHFRKDTILIVLSGCARIGFLNGDVMALSTLQSLYVPKGKFHSVGSFSEKTCILEIEVFSNDATFSDKNDLLRINDQYHRKSTGYQSSVKRVTDDLETYDFFEIQDGFRKVIDSVTLSTSKEVLNKQNTIQILLEGTLYCEQQVIKEGSILNSKNNYISLTPIVVLTITKHDWKEDCKIIHSFEHLKIIKKSLTDKKLILTSGCYDILHVGHLNTLKKAKDLGDILIVCLSSDKQIRALKGETRPINKFEDRLNLFKTIECVDYIFPYEEEYIETEETLGSIMKNLDPDVWVKGSDYTIQGIKEKHPYLRNIQIFPLVENKSTTNIIQRIYSDFKK